MDTRVRDKKTTSPHYEAARETLQKIERQEKDLGEKRAILDLELAETKHRAAHDGAETIQRAFRSYKARQELSKRRAAKAAEEAQRAAAEADAAPNTQPMERTNT